MQSNLITLLNRYRRVFQSKKRLAELVPIINSHAKKEQALNIKLQQAHDNIILKEEQEKGQKLEHQLASDKIRASNYQKKVREHRELQEKIKVLKYEQKLLLQLEEDPEDVKQRIETYLNISSVEEDKEFKERYLSYSMKNNELNLIERQINTVGSVCEELEDRLFLLYNGSTDLSLKQLNEHLKNLIGLLLVEVENLFNIEELSHENQSFALGLKYLFPKTQMINFTNKSPLTKSREHAKHLQVYFSDYSEKIKAAKVMTQSKIFDNSNALQRLLLEE